MTTNLPSPAMDDSPTVPHLLVECICGRILGTTHSEDIPARHRAHVAQALVDAGCVLGDETQRRLFDECETAGWDPDKRNTFGDEIAHLHEEISEAFRDWRVRKDCAIWHEASGKPRGVPIEFADVLIGLFYNAELHGFDLMAAAEIKHQWNLRRSYPDEGRQLHPTATRTTAWKASE